MLLDGLFQAWRSVCRAGASDLPTGERVVCFSGVCPRVPLVTRVCAGRKASIAHRSMNGCQLEKLRFAAPAKPD